jgi:Holliday junction resolvasome RuvABC endonuclease subunit
MTSVLGIDPSLTSTGFYEILVDKDGAVFDGQFGLIKPKSRDNERLVECGVRLKKMISLIQPAIIVYEGYSYGSRYGKMFQIGELGGVYRYHLHRMGYMEKQNLFIVAPKTLKKFAFIGDATKEDIRLAIKRRWGRDIPQNDIADAYVLARIGACVYDRSGLTPKEREIVKTITRMKKNSDTTQPS